MFSEASHEASCCEASVFVFCAKGFFGVFFRASRGRTGPGNPGKSWNFTLAFSRTGKFWKMT